MDLSFGNSILFPRFFIGSIVHIIVIIRTMHWNQFWKRKNEIETEKCLRNRKNKEYRQFEWLERIENRQTDNVRQQTNVNLILSFISSTKAFWIINGMGSKVFQICVCVFVCVTPTQCVFINRLWTPLLRNERRRKLVHSSSSSCSNSIQEQIEQTKIVTFSSPLPLSTSFSILANVYHLPDQRLVCPLSSYHLMCVVLAFLHSNDDMKICVCVQEKHRNTLQSFNAKRNRSHLKFDIHRFLHVQISHSVWEIIFVCLTC